MAIRLKARSTTPGDVRLASGVLSQLLLPANIRKGVERGDNELGTLVGCVDSAGSYNATGVIYGSGDYATEASRNNATAGAGQILTGYSVTLLGSTINGSATAEAHTADQVLKSAGGNYNDDNLSVGNVRPVAFGLSQTGTLESLVATDAAYVSLEESRNNDNGTVAADIVTGKSVKIRNTTTNGSYSPDFPDVENVLTTDTVNGSPGTYTGLSTLVVKHLVLFGPSKSLVGEYSPGGTFTEGQADQLATDQAAVDAAKAGILTTTTILAITGTFDEAARNTDPGEAFVFLGTTYKIQNVAKTGTLVGGGGYVYGDNDPSFVLTTADGAGDYLPIADSDTVDGGVSYGDGEVGTGVNATTLGSILDARNLTSSYIDATITSRHASGAAVASVTEKTGFKLAADGLDAITATRPTGVATTFPQMLVQLFYRFFGKATKTSTQLKTYAANGSTVVTTQTVVDDGTTETQGESS